MSESPKKKKQYCRDAWNEVFDKLGGVEHLMQWAIEHPSEYYKIMAKLAPPIKEDKGVNETHDAFIKMIMREQEQQLKELDKPVKLIDVTINDDGDSG